MATHFRILAWRIPWTEEPGELQSIGLQRVGHSFNSGSTTVSISLYVCEFACLCVYLHVNVCECLCEWVCVHTSVCEHRCEYVSVYGWVCLCVCE